MDNDPVYYQRRLNQAQRLAEQASDPSIRSIHLEMAERYRPMALRSGVADKKI